MHTTEDAKNLLFFEAIETNSEKHMLYYGRKRIYGCSNFIVK